MTVIEFYVLEIYIAYFMYIGSFFMITYNTIYMYVRDLFMFFS